MISFSVINLLEKVNRVKKYIQLFYDEKKDSL